MDTIDTLDTQPFKNLVMSIGALPSSFVDSMSYYEALAWLVKYLQTQVIPAVNNNAEALSELQTAFVTLKDYVDHYFDNLDVQEEINNKLDEMAEDGTLEDLIADFIIGGKGQVKYYFPNSTDLTTFWVLIQAYGKNILYDTGRGTALDEPTNLEENLTLLGIDHIDYVAISHYHYDHVAGLSKLIDDGYVDETTTLYLPSFNTSVWSANSAYPQYNALMNKLQTLGWSYVTPSEGMKIELNDSFSFQFYNTNDTYYIDNSINSDYNNASMFMLIRHFGINTLLIADAYKHALKHITDNGVIPQTLHLYNVGHHGIVDRDNSTYAIMSKFNIENIVQVVGISDVADGKCSSGGEPTDDKSITDNIFVTAYNKKMVEFSSFINSMNLVNGYKSGTDNLNNTVMNLYVDENATDEQDGSINHPFKQLNQCLGFCQRNKGVDYIIHLADGEYKIRPETTEAGSHWRLWKPAIKNTNNTIEIVGESKAGTIIDDGFEIQNASNVYIHNATIQLDVVVYRLINIYNSTVTIEDCNLVSLATQKGIYAENSKLIVKNCSLDTCANGIETKNSFTDIIGCTFANMTYSCFIGDGGCFNEVSGITISDSSNCYNYANNKPAFNKGFEIFNGEAKWSDTNHQFNTLAYGGRFSYLEVYYTFRGTKGCRKGIYESGTNLVVGIGDTFISDTYSEQASYSVKISFPNNSNTATFNWSRKFSSKEDGTLDFIDNNNDVVINRVIAY